MNHLASKDVWSGLLFVAAGTGFLILAQQNPLGSAGDMGPAFFPSVVSLLLIGLGLISLVRTAWQAGEPLEWGSLRPLLVVVVATLAFGALVTRGGLLLAIAVLVGIGAFARPRPHPLETALLIVALMIIGTVVFVWGLGVMLPLGPAW